MKTKDNVNKINTEKLKKQLLEANNQINELIKINKNENKKISLKLNKKKI